MNWSSRPFVRALLFLLTGILLGYAVPLGNGLRFYIMLIGVLIVFLLIAIIGLYRNQRFKYQWVQGFILGTMLTVTGVLLVSLQMDSSTQSLIEEVNSFNAQVVDDPLQTQQSVKMILAVHPSSNDESNVSAVRVIAFFEKDENSEALKYGDLLLFQAKVSTPHKPMNPGEFDYKNFLALNGIHYSVFIPADKWKYLGNNSPNIFRKLAGRLRNYLLNALQENGLGERNYAVAAAILLGYDNLMDTELEQDFVTAGAMHILCVSGLHVGVIYLVFNFLFGYFRKTRLQQMMKAMLLLLLIWVYAMLTGLAPSVQRAAVMISIFIIGNAINRPRDSYNTLAASAFLLLLINPLLIFNVGFQLSYAAVLGILTFHPVIYKLLYFKHSIADKLWSITVLSFAAQLGTFPLAAHYFHFFPTYFWLTNLMIFPLSFLIIVGGMAFIFVSWIPLISKVAGLLLSGLVFLLNQIVGLVKFLPYHGINDLFFSWTKVLLVYALIVLIYIMLSQKRVRMLIPVLLTLLLLIAFETIHRFNVLKQKRIVVYSMNKSSAYDFIRGDEHLLLLDSMALGDIKSLDYFLTNSRLEWGLEPNRFSLQNPNPENTIGLYFDGEFAFFEDVKIAIVDDANTLYPTHQKKIKLDAIIVKGNKSLDLKQLLTCFNVNTLILDASVPYWKTKKIVDESETLGIGTYNVKEEGAFIFDLTTSAQ